MEKFFLSYQKNDKVESVEVNSGEIVFVVGANGTGKSTLMHRFATQNKPIVKINAHRQLWFNFDNLDLTSEQRDQNKKEILQHDLQASSRWSDRYSVPRIQCTLYNIIDAENVQARKVVEMFRSGAEDDAKTLAGAPSKIQIINEILKVSHLDFAISINQVGRLVVLRGGGRHYLIKELSDGERNALLTIAEVLTAPENALILLEEPERHLHPSIVSPLLTQLLVARKDCAFVVSSHDVWLPLGQNNAAVFLVRKYNHQPQWWDIDYISSMQEMDEEVAKAVLGSRGKTLFIEGDFSSLDIQIYEILYPELSIKPVGNCAEVERMVKALNSFEAIHRISAIGIIDRDYRTDLVCEKLISNRIFPIKCYSIESIYYHPTVISWVLGGVEKIDFDKKFESLTDCILREFNRNKDVIVAKRVEQRIRKKVVSQAPNWELIRDEKGDIKITVPVRRVFNDEVRIIDSLIRNRNIEKILSDYPIKKTGITQCVASLLGFHSPADYEDAVREIFRKDRAKINELDLLTDVTEFVARWEE